MHNMEFNNQSKGWIYLLEGRSKSPYFPINRSFTQIGNTHRIKSTKRGLLEITQPIGFISNSMSSLELEDELANWLVTNDWTTLKFSDEPGRLYQAVVQNDMSDFRRFASLRQGIIQFIARAAEGETHLLEITSTGKMFKIEGQVSTPWVATVNFTESASNYKLEFVNNKIILNYEFVSGDQLKINYETRSINLNGNNIDVGLSLNSSWQELTPGYAEVVSSQLTTIRYNERFN